VSPTAGYSGKPLVDKLGIKPGMRVQIMGAPKDFELGPLPPGVRTGARKQLDLVMFFTTKKATLARRWHTLTATVVPGGAVWVAWPKKASGVETDVTEDVVREVVLPTGWVDVKVCAVDDTWSGLKCVLRVALR